MEELFSMIGGMAQATRAIAEAAKVIREKAKKSPEVDKAVSEVLEQAIALQSRQIDLQTAILRLQKENGELAEQLRAYEVRSRTKERYELKEVGRSWVMVAKEDPKVQCCPVCMETKAHEIVLQRHPKMTFAGDSPTHLCPLCQTAFYLF